MIAHGTQSTAPVSGHADSATSCMSPEEKAAAYRQAREELAAILAGETHPILKMATINCVLREHFPYYFWTGFYLVHNGELVVGPYQGTLGCLHIPFGKGVCGTAAATRRTIVVPDVRQFPGHIACDSRSRSEIVVPVLDVEGRLIAVFDVDSTELASFDETDKSFLEEIIASHFRGGRMPPRQVFGRHASHQEVET